MSTIEELKKLQNYNINNAKPLTVRGQYSNNINTNINRIVQSVSLLTTELNNINSSVKESSLNGRAIFSMDQWVNNTKTALLSQLFPSIQTLIGNPKPLTKILVLTNTVVTTSIQSALNQQDSLLNQLEDQVLKIVEKQNNVKVEKDKDGNIILVPILNEQAQKSLSNVTKILKSTIVTIDKINTRISNEKPLKTVDDFVNNLSINHVIEFAQKIIAVLTITLQILITIRKTRDLITASTNPTLAVEYTERAAQYTATEQRRIDDLSSAQITISVLKSQITFYQSIIQTIIDKLKEILDLLKVVDTSFNKDITELENKLNSIINENQQTLNTNKEIIEKLRIIQTNIPNYAAKIVE
jgi:hypothetical protein